MKRQSEKVENTLESLKQKHYYFEPEKRSLFFSNWSYKSNTEISVTFWHGYGLNIETVNYDFPASELSTFVKNLKPKNLKPKNLKPNIYSLTMSEKTENNISTLRTHLFSAIEKLEGGTMKSDEAKALASLAQTIINSAKLELDYKRMIEKQPNILMLNS